MLSIFAVTYGSIHAQIAIRMAKAFQERDIHYTILALPAAISECAKMGVNFKRLSDYQLLFPEWEIIQKYGNGLAKQHHNEQSGICFSDTADYYGIGFVCLMQEYGEANAIKMMNKEGRFAFMPVSALEKIIRFENPSFVQVTCDARYELAATRAAKKLGIPSYYIQDSPFVLRHLENNFYFLINDEMKTAYLQAGIHDACITVTGQPCYEAIGDLRKDKERAELEKQFGTSRADPLILWLPSKLNDHMVLTFSEICTIARRHPRWNILIKLHPTSGNMNEYDPYVDKMPDNIRFIKNYDSLKLIKACDVAITYTSTSGFEALLLDINLVIINLTSDEFKLGYDKKSAAILVKDAAALEGVLLDVLYSEATQKQLAAARKRYHSNPRACENIVESVSALPRREL